MHAAHMRGVSNLYVVVKIYLWHCVCDKCAVAVDMSHSQNAILELKLAAIRYLDYIDFLVLIGEKDDPKRDRYEDLKVGCHSPHVRVSFRAKKSMPPNNHVLTEHAQ